MCTLYVWVLQCFCLWCVCNLLELLCNLLIILCAVKQIYLCESKESLTDLYLCVLNSRVLGLEIKIGSSIVTAVVLVHCLL